MYLFKVRYRDVLKRIGTWCLLSIISISTSFAQIDSLQKLKEITVLGTYHQQAFFPTQELHKTALQNLQNYSVADALRFFSGVQIKDYGGIGGLKTVDVHSLGTQHTGVFYDGLAINDVQNGTVDLGKYSLENLESVALTFGQNANLLKSAKEYATANMITLKSKKPIFSPERSQHWKTRIKGGSFGLLNSSLLWQQRLGTQIANSLNIEHTQANGRFPFRLTLNRYTDTVVYRENAAVNNWRIEDNLDGNWQKHEWKIKTYYYQSKRGLPDAVVENKYTTQGKTLYDRDAFAQFSFKKQQDSARLQYQISGKYSHLNSRYLDKYWYNSLGVLDQYYAQKEAYVSTTALYKLWNCTHVSLANDFTFQKLDSDLFGFVYPRRKNISTAIAFLWQWKDIGIQGNILRQQIIETTKNSTLNRDTEKWSPTLAINWKPSSLQNLQLNAFYKESFRMPNFNELYYTLLGNSKLLPETAKQWALDINFTQLSSQKHILQNRLHLFFNTVKNKIVSIPNVNLFRWSTFNLLQTRSAGISPMIEYTYQYRYYYLHTVFQYTYNLSRQQNHDSKRYSRLIPYTAIHTASYNLQAGYQSWRLNYAMVYTGKRYRLSDPVPQNQLLPWYTHDIGLQRKINYKQLPFTAGIQINNLFNQRYEVVSNFPMPGINAQFFLSVDI